MCFAPRLRPGMAGMTTAIVRHLQQRGGEGLLERGLDSLRAGLHAPHIG